MFESLERRKYLVSDESSIIPLHADIREHGSLMESGLQPNCSDIASLYTAAIVHRQL